MALSFRAMKTDLMRDLFFYAKNDSYTFPDGQMVAFTDSNTENRFDVRFDLFMYACTEKLAARISS